jgi:hypothetical protein
MSTPECDEAQNQTVRAPKKPSSFEVDNPGRVVARHLIPFINGSQEFEALFHETDSYCFYGSSHNLEVSESSQLSCSMLNLSLANRPATIAPSLSIPVQARRAFQNIALVPLPPSLGARNTWSLIYWIDKSTRILSTSLFIYVYIQFWRRPRFQYNPSDIRGIFETPTSRITGLSNLGGLVEIRIIGKLHFLYWPLGQLAVLCCLSIGASLEVWDLAKWFAKDAFLDSCLASKVSIWSMFEITKHANLIVFAHGPVIRVQANPGAYLASLY